MPSAKNAGFSLIELMIVISVIGILAAIAIPAYQDYTIRAQVSEGIGLAAPVEVAAVDYYAQNGVMPNGLTGGGASLNFSAFPSGNYVARVVLSSGVIFVQYGNKANALVSGYTLVFSPGITSSGTLMWICGNATPPPGVSMLATGSASMAVPTRYLPKNCQS